MSSQLTRYRALLLEWNDLALDAFVLDLPKTQEENDTEDTAAHGSTVEDHEVPEGGLDELM